MAELGAGLEEYTDDELATLASMNFAICVGTFYEDLTERLLRGAREGFKALGLDSADVTTAMVPGAFELPMAAKMLAESFEYGPIAGVACLGAVIRGETGHYDFVCSEAARGIQEVQLRTGVPCAFGVITCDTMEQALARSGGDKRNQGRNAALTVARMALLKKHLA